MAFRKTLLRCTLAASVLCATHSRAEPLLDGRTSLFSHVWQGTLMEGGFGLGTYVRIDELSTYRFSAEVRCPSGDLVVVNGFVSKALEVKDWNGNPVGTLLLKNKIDGTYDLIVTRNGRRPIVLAPVVITAQDQGIAALNAAYDKGFETVGNAPCLETCVLTEGTRFFASDWKGYIAGTFTTDTVFLYLAHAGPDSAVIRMEHFAEGKPSFFHIVIPYGKPFPVFGKKLTLSKSDEGVNMQVGS